MFFVSKRNIHYKPFTFYKEIFDDIYSYEFMPWILERLWDHIFEFKLKNKNYKNLNWFAYKHIYDKIYEEIPENGTFVEVGCLYGDSTVYFANKIKKGNKHINFYCIDLWTIIDNTENYLKEYVFNDTNDIYNDFLQHLEEEHVKNYVTILRGNSNLMYANFENDSIDAIMLDADHSYEGLKSDIELYLPKVKINGKIYGDDYGHPDFTGIQQAVTELLHDVILYDTDRNYKIWEFKK